jgi:predicted lipid-binding transport protein (Tim44 family)
MIDQGDHAPLSGGVMAGLSAGSPLIIASLILWLTSQFPAREGGSLPDHAVALLKRLHFSQADPSSHQIDFGVHISAQNKARVLSVVAAIFESDAAFTLPDFLSEASGIFEDVMLACWRSDRSRLFLSAIADDVFEDLAAAISLRATRRECTDVVVEHLSPPQIIDASIAKGKVSFTLRLDAEIATVVRDCTGAIIAGDPEKVWQSSDVWTFTRPLLPARDGWRVAATETGDLGAQSISIVGQYRPAA